MLRVLLIHIYSMSCDKKSKKRNKQEEWEEVEEYLKEYIGTCYEIVETADKIYIGIRPMPHKQ